ncbi:hypothetical protein [Streptomyces aidingensis]|uniref:Protein kinase domain-containing protein n=1 Tax=Streptomyces aidingensis TaxID=910347 RepID=A0A1I1EC69_9ACTN|nr:hypothetical protein [Streptomyces aidingensis]SFB84647.1 hypothetical protein SAMN05421773_101239 [Streptomyces aidingensis]
MTTQYRTWPLPAVVPLAVLGPLDTPLSKGDGQSRMVSPLKNHDGWLAKLYQSPLGAGDAGRLDALIALPGAAREADRELLRTATSWPVARITGGAAETVGCVIPAAPAGYRFGIRTSAGRATEKYLDIDWLARPGEALSARAIPAPSDAERLRVCRSVVAVAACLERHGIVYSDWSYSNTFWDPLAHTAFVIDVDGCGPARVSNVFQPNWEDPLTARTVPADGATDRYRVALLVARCLTGEREVLRVLHAIAPAAARAGVPDAGEMLLDMLLAQERRLRPTLDSLLAALEGRSAIRMPVQRMKLPALPARPGGDPRATAGAATATAGPAAGPAAGAGAGTAAGPRLPPRPPAGARPGQSGSGMSQERKNLVITMSVVVAILLVILVVGLASSS